MRSCRGGFLNLAGLLSLHQTDAIALAGEAMGDRAAYSGGRAGDDDGTN
jgi:hypothetical protein